MSAIKSIKRLLIFSALSSTNSANKQACSTRWNNEVVLSSKFKSCELFKFISEHCIGFTFATSANILARLAIRLASIPVSLR